MRAVIGIGLFVGTAMTLYPPWIVPAGEHYMRSLGWSFLWAPPRETAEIDLVRLGLQWLILGAIIGGIAVLMPARSEKPRSTQTSDNSTSKTNGDAGFWFALGALAVLGVVVTFWIVWSPG